MAELTEKNTAEAVKQPTQSKNTGMSTEELIEKYKTPVLAGLGIVVVLIAAFVFYKYNQSEKSTTAQEEMEAAVFYFEQDSLELALKGNPAKEIMGLEEVAEEYAGTDAGNLAAFYTGIIYLKQGKFEQAISHLENYSSSDGIMQARSWAAMGDAYSDLKDGENAIKYYKKAAEHKPNEQLTPSYLMKLALAYEVNKDWKSAAEAYDKIITDFPKSQDVADAKKYKAKAQALSASE
ncbi:MAG: tetratricopeptide repeat protein [Cytophaga sp.]|uniref:tetratricopeptide repeat protein n=1 Tax=Cytophaga sp. TaxID=29535 RepID=UPI003F7E8B8D